MDSVIQVPNRRTQARAACDSVGAAAGSIREEVNLWSRHTVSMRGRPGGSADHPVDCAGC